MEYLKRCSKNLLFRLPHGVGIIYPPLPLVTQVTGSILFFLSPPSSSFSLPWGASRQGRPAGGELPPRRRRGRGGGRPGASSPAAAARPGRRPAGGELPRGGGAAGARASRGELPAAAARPGRAPPRRRRGRPGRGPAGASSPRRRRGRGELPRGGGVAGRGELPRGGGVAGRGAGQPGRVGDPFNSDPDDPEVMGPEVRERVLQGDTGIPVTTAKITMVDLPLGATEDRVCGTIDIEKALTEGVKAFEPGLLAKANRGILYVDEVNLLDDHLVDVLPDSAASGWNTVEREGISISHPARFILIGSGNPEEGELRPQLLDRFGMHAQVGTVRDAELRVKIVEERARFDRDPKAFRDSYKEEQEKLQDQISSARSNLGAVQIDHDLRVKISKVCSELNVDGLRGDIVTNRAAKALASLKGRDKVTVEDIATVIPNCLRHRLRKDPLESIDSGLLVIEKFYEVFS